jgi:hypothetical protein
MPSTLNARSKVLAIAVLVTFVIALALAFYRPFPPDRTPDGAYARIAKAVSEQRPRDVFPYLEQDAQDAAFSIRDMRKAARDAIERSYPKGAERDSLLASYRAEANAPDGVDVFVLVDHERDLIARLRKDMSGIANVEVEGDRATVITARGTRYSFRRRPNGVWGLTLFSAELLAESERAARDLVSVRAAAADYARAQGSP